MATASRAFALLTIILFVFIEVANGLPRQRVANISRENIKHSEMLPLDHIAGAHMEHDGDLNKNFHHETFLGKLVKQGKLEFGKMDGYRKLINIFHKVDTDSDHLIDHQELQNWIYGRILDHYFKAIVDSDVVFKKVDLDKNDQIRWYEYKAALCDLDPEKLKAANVSLESDSDGQFSKEVEHWYQADLDNNKILNSTEFLAFMHPEYNRGTLHDMAEEMMERIDKNGDKRISLEEFTALLPGGVDPEKPALDGEYIAERTREFREMDQDVDGWVTMTELKKYLAPTNLQHAVNEAQYLIRIADKNGDSRINEEEMLTNYALFTGSTLANNSTVLHDDF